MEVIYNLISDPLSIAFVVFFFGASIFVHEYGHYITARMRNMYVGKFSIGFGPRLFGWTDKKGVEWRVSAIPLGGYVSLPQLADLRGIEGDYGDVTKDLPPASFTDKVVVAAGGAVFNVLFALLLGCILWVLKTEVSEFEQSRTIGYIFETVTNKEGNEQPSPSLQAGLQAGDEILEIDGSHIANWQDVMYAITTGTGRSDYGQPKATLRVKRGSEELDVTVFPVLGDLEGLRTIGIWPSDSLAVGRTYPNSPAEAAGIQAGDKITAVDGMPLHSYLALTEYITAHGTKPLQLTLQRNGGTEVVTLAPEEVTYNTAGDTAPKIGVIWARPTKWVRVTPFEHIWASVRTTFRVLTALLHPQSDIQINHLSGPVGISYSLYQTVSMIGFRDLLALVILINVNLAILNLLPIPVLDGGHILFATIAKVRGKPLNPNFIISAQSAFLLFFLFIFVYVTFRDIGRVGRSERASLEAREVQNQRVEIVFGQEEEPPPEDDGRPENGEPAPASP